MRIALIRLTLIFTLTMLVTASVPVMRFCGDFGFTVLPLRKVIKKNSLIILTAYGESQRIIDFLNQKYPVYLESKDHHRVNLNLKSVYEGMYNETQAILEPAEELVAGKTYYFKIDSLRLNAEKRFLYRRTSGFEMEPIAWTIEPSTDTELPVLLNPPKWIGKYVENNFCSAFPTYALFKISVRDVSEVLVKTEFVELETGRSAIFCLPFDQKDTLWVGAGSCAGPFTYRRKKGKYKVRFSLMDICGNTNNQWTEWIEYDNPYYQYYEEVKKDYEEETKKAKETGYRLPPVFLPPLED
jgi:hypothetical protein